MRLSKSLVWFALAACAMPLRVHAAEEGVTARVVLQTLPFGGVEVAAWTPDDKQIITAVSPDRSVLIWDVATGTIQDRLILPSENAGGRMGERILTALTISENGKIALIDGVSADASTGTTVLKPFRYSLDLVTHEISLGRVEDVAAADDDITAMRARLKALADIYEDTDDAADPAKAAEVRAAAAAQIEPLPAAHDGKRTLRRDPAGLAIDEAGKEPVLLMAQRPVRFSDAALSPDGTTLALAPRNATVGEGGAGKISRIAFMDLATGQFGLPVSLPGTFDHVEWVTPELLLAAQWTSPGDIDDPYVVNDPAKDGAVLVEAGSGVIAAKIPGRCAVTHRSETELFGAGLANCRAGSSDFALQKWDAVGGWRPFGKLALPKGAWIENLAVSGNGATLLVALLGKDELASVVLLDAATGAVRHKRNFKLGGGVTKLSMPGDGEVLVAIGNQVGLWDPRNDSWDVLPMQATITNVATGNDDTIVIGGLRDDELQHVGFAGDGFGAVQGVPFVGVLAGDFLPDSKLFWAFSADSILRVWRAEDWSELFSTYLFDNDGFLTVAADGRYDTNLGPDTHLFRWVVTDEPDRSFAATTFMRQYYLPSLAPRLLDCTIAGDCAAKLGTPTPVGQLNRTVPEVTITEVAQGSAPDQVLISLEIREGNDPGAANGKTTSGVYGAQIFANGKLVSTFPDLDYDLATNPPTTLSAWRDANRLKDDDDKRGDGVWHLTTAVALPTAAGTESQIFSAYAFNEDRVKSIDALFAYERAKMPARTPRAFVISIGIDAYDVDSMSLNYAAADARMIDAAIGDIPGFEMHRLVLAGDRPVPGKKVQRVTADAINAVVAILAGLPVKDAEEELGPANIDARTLDMARPDDLVIMTFSGHGWADPQSKFYLLPSDVLWSEDDNKPTGNVVGMDELTMWLRYVNAGEIALVFDACHSGAGVDQATFRPGPMGDPGLGQLAYDKGIRVLVATQADDVAWEDARLKHGLLSYALAAPGEALSGELCEAGCDTVSLDAWLSYPTWRVESLAREGKVGGLVDEQDESAFRFPRRQTVVSRKVQEPTLIDYAGISTVQLRTRTP